MRITGYYLILVTACALACTSAYALQLRRLTMENGLSNNEVYTIIQDSRGYMWFATGDGVNRYDGYDFKIFRHDPNNQNSLSGNFVRAFHEDAKGRLWIGTFANGLDLYDPKSGIFRHYRHINGDPESLISDNIWSLNSLPDGRLLIGTRDSGVDILDPKTGKFRHYTAGAGPDSLKSNKIQNIFVDSHARVWLATSAGLDEFDPDGKQLFHHLNVPQKGGSGSVISIAEDVHHRLWLATMSGPYIYTPGDASITTIPGIPPTKNPMTGVQLYSVIVDMNQNVWFGAEQTGLYLIPHGSDHVLHYQNQVSNNESLPSNTIYDLTEDKSGYIWLGTSSGISMLDPGTLGIYSPKPSDIESKHAVSGEAIMAMYVRHDGLLLGGLDAVYWLPLSSADTNLKSAGHVFAWLDQKQYGGVDSICGTAGKNVLIGTGFGRLLETNSTGGIIRNWLPGTDIGSRSRQIHQILPLNHHEIYLATFYTGLLDFDPETSKTLQIAGDSPKELNPGDIVETLLRTSPSKVWAGTFRGLFQVDTESRRSALLPMMPGNLEPAVEGLYEDPQHTLWIASYEGLWKLKLDDNGDAISKPEVVPTFHGTQILAIEPDTHGRLWLATVNSLIRFDPRDGETLTYGRNQGSPISEYFSYGHTQTPDGWVWFGGGQGAIGFDPDILRPNAKPFSVVLNGVTSYQNGRPLYQSLTPGVPLTLTYQDSISTFDVAATDFDAPQTNTYSYRLLGFQSQWTPPNNSHQITFTNLSPGRYRLEVKAANNWGIWSTVPAVQDIIVLPPWWRTWWAYTFYLLLIIGSSVVYVYSLKRKIEREQEISTNLREANDIKSNFVEKLESQVRKATHELRETLQGVNLKNAELEIAQKRATEAEQVKSQFLANMSHELRTPLTGVLGYTKLLGSTHLNSEQKDYVSTIKQSSETLLAIINDTLDLSRLDAGKLLIDQVDFDLLEVIESTLELLAPTAYQKRLELVRVIAADVPLYLRGDPLRLRQVLTNLLSNAIKFTEHGSVAVEVKALLQDEREAKLAFTVSDTGIGIPAGELPKLFHAYARSRISTQHHVEGTGLGLAICKKLLDLMGGDIRVTSKVGTGTSFQFELVFKLQKNAEPRSRLPRKIKVLLYDAHSLSSQAWRACLMRLGAEVETVPNLESVVSLKADAAIMVLSEKELTQLGELKRSLTPVLPPMLILAPRIERQALKDLSETLFHRVLSKTAREKTLYLELQSLLQTVVHEGDAAPRQAPVAAEPAADAPKILVADDNRINRRLLVTMLNHAGFRVSEAANGLELLDLAAKGQWDAALLDIHMPGMDGIEAAKRLRESLGDSLPPIIAMSADVMPETRTQVLEGLMDDFMVKPFSEQELVDKLRWHLDRHSRKRRSTIQGS